ncbi:50S ribosomal protein L6 [Candidatus Gracilibacteria bacterium]|nr:50S ribosomal protein L6 [Candidatus Gracilibacteria bacterium]
MSRIGKLPVPFPENIEVRLEGDCLVVKGPKGELKMNFDSAFVSLEIKDHKIIVTRKDDSKAAKGRHGLYRNLARNLVLGVTKGFSKTLEIKGVGYRAALQGRTLELNLGFSHPIKYNLPEGVDVVFEEKSQTNFTISGIDKQLVGQVAADIRDFKKPEPYKGKGIKYSDEYVARKAGKSVSKKS